MKALTARSMRTRNGAPRKETSARVGAEQVGKSTSTTSPTGPVWIKLITNLAGEHSNPLLALMASLLASLPPRCAKAVVPPNAQSAPKNALLIRSQLAAKISKHHQVCLGATRGATLVNPIASVISVLGPMGIGMRAVFGLQKTLARSHSTHGGPSRQIGRWMLTKHAVLVEVDRQGPARLPLRHHHQHHPAPPSALAPLPACLHQSVRLSRSSLMHLRL